MRQLFRDISLMVLTVIVGAFAGLVLSAVNRTDWNTTLTTWYAVVIGLLLIIIWMMLRGLRKLSEKEEKQKKIDNEKLINDTVDATLKDLGLKK